MNELKSCPFCGSEAELRSDSDEITMDGKLPFWVCCTHCMGSAGSHYEEGDAIETWNDRAKFSTIEGMQLISEEAISYLHDQWPSAYKEFYERL